MISKAHPKLGLPLLLISAAAVAGTVTVNGTTWECQNQCTVSTYPNGGTMVKDSAGGWIRRTSNNE